MSFTPRFNDNGIVGNYKWYSRNPFYTSGYGLPNCTCYAWGRFWEISDPNNTGANRPINLPRGNGNQWYDQNWYYEKNTYTPKLGAVVCFGGASPGHVAVVEEIRDDGDTIVTSNSDWKGRFFYTETLHRRPDGKFRHPHRTKIYLSQGFIYNPFAGDTPGPSPTPTTTVKKKFPWPVAWQHWSNFKH